MPEGWPPQSESRDRATGGGAECVASRVCALQHSHSGTCLCPGGTRFWRGGEETEGTERGSDEQSALQQIPREPRAEAGVAGDMHV